jgi:hypothetical protein
MSGVIPVILSAVVPGLGHLLTRRYLKGVVLALVFTTSAELFLLARFWWPSEAGVGLAWASVAVAAAVWIYALGDAVSASRHAGEAFVGRKDDLLRRAQVAWLKRDNAEAEALLRRLLAMDERDVEGWIHLGKVLKSSGKDAEARRCFRAARNLDGSERWRWELERELTGVKAKTPEPEPSQGAPKT